MYHRENYSTKNNNSEKQFANADRESILYIHLSQVLGRVYTTLFNIQKIVSFVGRPVQDQNIDSHYDWYR